MSKYIVVTATVLAACCVVLLLTAIAIVWSQLDVFSQYGSFDFINYIEMAYGVLCITIPVCVVILWYWISDQIHFTRMKIDHIMELERLRGLNDHNTNKETFGEPKH